MSTRLVIVTHVVKADTDTVIINVSIATTVDGDLKQFDRQKSKLEHEGDWEKKPFRSTTNCAERLWRSQLNRNRHMTNEKLDVALAKHRTELILWIVGTVGLGVIVNHFWRIGATSWPTSNLSKPGKKQPLTNGYPAPGPSSRPNACAEPRSAAPRPLVTVYT